MRKADVDEVCRHFPELSTALQEVANLRSRQFLVKTSNPLKDGDIVKVVKEGSSVFGRKAKVVNSDWNGLVKVTLVGETAFKTYKRSQLELDVSILQKFKKGDMVRIIKYGSKMGRIARVEDPAWNDLVKVTLVGDTAFRSYHRYELENASDADVAETQKRPPNTVSLAGKIDLPDHSSTEERRPLDNFSPSDDDPEHRFLTSLSPIAYSKVRGAAKKWLAQIKEREACDNDSDVTSIIGVDTCKKTSGDCPVGSTSEQNLMSLSSMAVAHQEAEVTLI